MTLPRTVADVLSDHVVFEIESIDRLYLNVYQPKLQYGSGVQGFFVGHRGHKYASSVLMRPVTDAFVANIHHYVAVHGLDLVHFRKGERKDDIAKRYLAEATRADGSVPEGILFVGRAQEKALVFGTQKRRNPVTGASYAWLVRESVLVNHFYFYGFDEDFGPYADPPAMPRQMGSSWLRSGCGVRRGINRVGCAGQSVSRKARRLSGAVYRPGWLAAGVILPRACSFSAMSVTAGRRVSWLVRHVRARAR